MYNYILMHNFVLECTTKSRCRLYACYKFSCACLSVIPPISIIPGISRSFFSNEIQQNKNNNP